MGYAIKDLVLVEDSLKFTGFASWLPKNHRVFENYGDGVNTHDFNKYDKYTYGNNYDSLNKCYTKIHETHVYVKYLPKMEKDALTKVNYQMDDIERIVD